MAPPNTEFDPVPPDIPESREWPASGELDGSSTASAFTTRIRDSSATLSGSSSSTCSSILQKSTGNSSALGSSGTSIETVYAKLFYATGSGSAATAIETTVLREVSNISAAGASSTAISSLFDRPASGVCSGSAAVSVRERQVQAVRLEVSWLGLEFDGGEIKQASASITGSASVSISERKNSEASATVTALSGAAEVSAENIDGPALVVSWLVLDVPSGPSAFTTAKAAGSSSTDCVAVKTISPLGSIQGVGRVQISSSFVKSLTATVLGEAVARISTFSNIDDYVENWNCNISGANPAWGCESSQSEPVWSIVNGTTGASVEVWSSVSQGAAPSWGAVNTGQEIEWTKAART